MLLLKLESELSNLVSDDTDKTQTEFLLSGIFPRSGMRTSSFDFSTQF